MGGNHRQAVAEPEAAMGNEWDQGLARQLMIGQKRPDDWRGGFSPDRETKEDCCVLRQICNTRLKRRSITAIALTPRLFNSLLIVFGIWCGRLDFKQRRVQCPMNLA